MRKWILSILVCVLSVSAMAGTDFVKQLLIDLFALEGKPVVVEDKIPYTRIQLTDSSTIELYKTNDSIIVLMTVCAPQCSSCARVYNKEWELIRTIHPPQPSIFPLATIENGTVVWRDNDDWEY